MRTKLISRELVTGLQRFDVLLVLSGSFWLLSEAGSLDLNRAVLFVRWPNTRSALVLDVQPSSWQMPICLLSRSLVMHVSQHAKQSNAATQDRPFDPACHWPAIAKQHLFLRSTVWQRRLHAGLEEQH